MILYSFARAAARAASAACAFALLFGCREAVAADVSLATVEGDDITGYTRVVTGVTVTETDPVWTAEKSGYATTAALAAAATAATNYTDSATNGLLRAETDPTVPAWAKSATKPTYSYSEITGRPTLAAVATSGNYNDLSNKPTIPTVPTNVSAFTNDAGYLTGESDPVWNAEKSGYATTAALAAAATAATNYTDSATNGLLRVESDPTVSAWAKAANKPSYAYSEITGRPTLATVATSGSYNDLSNKPTIPTVPTKVSAFTNDAGYLTGESDPVWNAEKSGYATTAALNASDRLIFAIVQGTNVLDVVTNYDSTAAIPERYLVQIDTNGARKVIWRESTMITNAIANALADFGADVEAALAAKADRAWGKYTSGLGAAAPEGVTCISTPELHIASGYEWEKHVTSGGAVWVLTSNGMSANVGAATNSFLEIAATDGTPIFRIEKTDTYLVGVDPSAISVIGGTCIVSIPVVSESHPFARVCTNLTNAVWLKEDADGMPSGSPATVAWSGTSGAWVGTIDFGNSPQGFCYFEYLQEGEMKIVNTVATDLSSGIYFDGHLYRPSDNDGKLEFIRVRE